MNQEAREELKPIIEKLKRYRNLTFREVATVRVYFCHWIDSPVWDRNPKLTPESWKRLAALRSQVHKIKSTIDVLGCLHTMTAEGMDPL